MKKSVPLFSFLIAAAALLQPCSIMAQHRLCGSQLLEQHVAESHHISVADLRAQKQNYYTTNTSGANTAAKGTNTSYTIPVVFHIVLDSAQIARLGGNSGIIDRINTQMQVLNEDYAAKNADTTLIPAAFKPVFGNMQLQFQLAHVNPANGPTPGYEIMQTTKTSFDLYTNTTGSQFGFSDAKYSSAGGLDSWDPTKYLNIWVVNMTQNGAVSNLLGITEPLYFVNNFGDPLVEVGVVLNYGAYGRRTSASQYFFSGIDKGRTLTHEIGHVFELRHTWGDDNGLCPGSGGADDGISDTPPETDATYCDFGVNNTSPGSGNHCPVYPLYDSCSPSGAGVMFMNFMDYVDDAAMQMFTKNQVTYARLNVDGGGESHGLVTHPELLDVSNVRGDETGNIIMSPNPAIANIDLIVPAAVANNLRYITVYNSIGQAVYSITPVSGKTVYNADLSTLSRGIYYVRCESNTGVSTQKLLLQ